MEQDKLIQERKEKFLKFIKKPEVWVLGLLVIALILGVYIRSMPMHDHGGKPGLWDITTDTWTLGPDLDPWLFLRTAETMIETGSIPIVDNMRNVPLGFDNTIESRLLPQMIAGTYYLFNLFGEYNIEFAGVIFPVIMFALTIITFFLFVREIFVRKTKKSKIKANIISFISTFFMIVTPVFLSRTVAGIPEKESAAFFFMFLSFYLFLKAWKSQETKSAVVFGILAGISTAAMGLIWGGFIFIIIPIAMSMFISFILDKVNLRRFIGYSSWLIITFLLMVIGSNKFSILNLLTSSSTALAPMVFFIIIINHILWNTKLAKNKYLNKLNLPKPIITLIVSGVFGIIFISIFLGPDFLITELKNIHQTIFKPVTGRWNTTVAENRQPYFTEWAGSFGPLTSNIPLVKNIIKKNIPLMFRMFFIGSIVLFKKMLMKLKNKDAWILTGLYVLLLMGMIFSRYSNVSTFNGENFISKFVYYGTVLLFMGVSFLFYIDYSKKENNAFKQIRFEYLLLFSLFLLCIFSARGAVRLIMVLGPIAPIFVGFLVVDSFEKWKKNKDEVLKILLLVFFIIILISSLFTFLTYYNTVKAQSYNFVPSHYNQQWQKAMDWVKQNTPEDSVFAHWWDYGYWVQSIGKRATVLDGGNAITYWNYLMGRYVLTGDNQKDSLEFLYNHDANYLLIDSTDIGKYGAFSSIGSNENYDRYSWIGTFAINEAQTIETKNKTTYVYSGGVALDEDLVIPEDDVFLPSGQTAVGAILLPMEKYENGINFVQPSTIMIYQGKQQEVKLRYLSINDEFIDFGSGIEGTAFIIPSINQNSQGGIAQNPLGAVMFISPRVMRGYLAQKYLLNDPFEEFNNFNLVHTESNLIIEQLRSQGMELPEFVYFQGLQGPIKIWDIEYTGNEEIKEEYLDKDSSKYLSWKL